MTNITNTCFSDKNGPKGHKGPKGLKGQTTSSFFAVLTSILSLRSFLSFRSLQSLARANKILHRALCWNNLLCPPRLLGCPLENSFQFRSTFGMFGLAFTRQSDSQRWGNNGICAHLAVRAELLRRDCERVAKWVSGQVDRFPFCLGKGTCHDAANSFESHAAPHD